MAKIPCMAQGSLVSYLEREHAPILQSKEIMQELNVKQHHSLWITDAGPKFTLGLTPMKAAGSEEG